MMKKLLFILMAVVFTACSPQEAVVEKSYTVVSEHPSESVFTQEGMYELLGHTDGSVDILFTDIATATRQPLANTQIEHSLKEKEANLFVAEDRLYLIMQDNVSTSVKDMESTVLYQFDLDGTLVNKRIFDKYFRPGISYMVSDGEKLYFTGVEYIQENGEYTGADGLYTLDPETLETEKLCDSAGFGIIGAWENKLIGMVSERNGYEFTSYIELMDMTTFERERLFETEHHWFQIDRKLYNEHEIPGSLQVYDMETGEFSQIKLFEYNSPLLTGNYGVNYFDGDEYILFEAGVTDPDVYTSYSYNLSTGEIKQTQITYDVLGRAGDCYLVHTGSHTVSHNSGEYEIYENDYAWIAKTDYINSSPVYINITNQIDYR